MKFKLSDGYGLIQDGNRRDGKKLVDSEYILKVEAQNVLRNQT